MTLRRLSISSLTLDPRVQPRETIDDAVVKAYAEEIAEGAKFPPPVVFDDGESLWLADGFHRVQAMSWCGLNYVEFDVHQGGLAEAVLFACGANAGQERTREDKRRVVQRLLSGEWGSFSDRKIAQICRVSHTLVADVRHGSLEPTASENPVPPAALAKAEAIRASGGEPRFYVTKHGTTSAMDTSRIGKPKLKLTVVKNDPLESLEYLGEELAKVLDVAAADGAEPTIWQLRRLQVLSRKIDATIDRWAAKIPAAQAESV